MKLRHYKRLIYGGLTKLRTYKRELKAERRLTARLQIQNCALRAKIVTGKDDDSVDLDYIERSMDVSSPSSIYLEKRLLARGVNFEDMSTLSNQPEDGNMIEESTRD